MIFMSLCYFQKQDHHHVTSLQTNCCEGKLICNMKNVDWIYDPWWYHVVSENLVNIGSGHGLLPDSTNPLHETLLTYSRWGLESKFHINSFRYQSLKFVWKLHDDVIKWKHFPRSRPFVWGIQWSPVNSPHKGQWRGALMFSLISARINGWELVRQVIWDAIMPIMT